MTAAVAWSNPANALPTGFSVAGPVGGAVLDAANDSTHLTVDQSSNRVVIDWSSFNIGTSDHVTFNQPSKNAIAFNVVNPTSLTTIDGHLNANGGVWLFSPAGIIFGSGSVVNTGSFLASTGLFNATSQAEALNDATGVNQIQIFSPPTPSSSITVLPSFNGSGTSLPAASIEATAGFVLLNAPTIEMDGAVTSDTDAV
ncbi:MAG TPA: filamentous hemagglutinin N-terminal domain-containing protein, partial [Caulobacteraceae bacterium]